MHTTFGVRRIHTGNGRIGMEMSILLRTSLYSRLHENCVVKDIEYGRGIGLINPAEGQVVENCRYRQNGVMNGRGDRCREIVGRIIPDPE